MKVIDILTLKGRDVATIASDASILDALRELGRRRIGALVVAGGDGAVAGIFSERDAVRAIAEKGGEALADPISSAMTGDVVTCSENDDVNALMELMTQKRFRHLPVIENGALVGIISIGDVVKERVHEIEVEAEAMRDYIAMS